MTKSGSRRERRKQAKRIGVLSDAQVALGWFIILMLAAVVGAIYLSQASRIASTGRKVQQLQNDLDELKRENAVLERAIAEGQALERLEAEAARLGFVRASPEEIEYMVVDEYPLATEPVVSGPTPTPLPPPVETAGEALLLALEDSLGNLATGESAGEDLPRQ